MPETNPLLEDAGIPQPETPAAETAETDVENTNVVESVVEPEVAEPEAEPEAEKKTDDIAARAQSLVRKESALVQREHKLKQQERDLAAAQQAAKEFEEIKNLSGNPLELLNRLGVNIDDVKARIAESDSTDPTSRLEREVEELKRQRREEAEAAKKEADNRQVQANVARHRQELSEYIKAHGDEFELVSAYGDTAIDLVQQTVIRHLQKTTDAGNPVLMSHEQAAKIVEDYLDKKYVQPAMKAKKVQSRFQAAPTAKVEAKTLENDLTPTKTVTDSDGKRDDETNDEYFERLLRKLGT